MVSSVESGTGSNRTSTDIASIDRPHEIVLCIYLFRMKSYSIVQNKIMRSK